MDYNINAAVFSNGFVFPAEVADKYLKFSKGDHLKVLIYIMRNSGTHPTVEEIAAACDLTPFEAKEALLFWADTGILVMADTESESRKNQNKVAVNLKPSREDITKRGLEDPKLHYLLNQAQLIFGRNLKSNEMQTLGWIYDDLGMDVSVVLYIVQYAKQNDKVNIRFIESLASDWVEKGVENINDAEEQVKQLALSQQAWNIVCSAFGIERRKPSKKESELSYKWINEWNISKEMLAEAYDICVDNKSKYSFSYIAKIIENWHNNGCKNTTDIKPQKDGKNKGVTYDIDLFEKMINSKD